MMADEQTVTDPNPSNEEADNGTILLDDVTPVPEKPEAPKPAPVDEGPVTYEPTGDVGLDMALEFMGKAGLDAAHPAMQAAMEGDFSILKATLAQKGVPGWEQMVALGEAAYTRAKEKEAASASALTELVHKEAGGKEEWGAIQAWAKANATPEERAQINGLLNQGGLAAKGAVKYLADAYSRATNVERSPSDPIANAGAGAPSTSAGPLNPRAYSAEVQKLAAVLGGRMEGSKEYAALQARRNAYRA
jgi:hypothetical protein